jgi:aminoglycoside 3-N-acetyltransferase I
VDGIRIVRLRSGQAAIAGALFAVMAEAFDEERAPLSESYIERLLDRSDFWAIAALAGDDVVGGLTAHTLPMTRTESAEIFVYDIAVRPDAQRKGIGRRLIAAVREQAAAVGIADLFVAADDEDQHALDFYRALGGVAAPVTMFTFASTDERIPR